MDIKYFFKYDQTIDLGEGVLIHYTDNKKMIFHNVFLEIQFDIRDSIGNLPSFSNTDVDYESVDQLPNSHNAHDFMAPYGFGVERYINGVALVWWTLYPDGRYFEDEDGFGGEDCDETIIYSFIDTSGKIVIPFQSMSEEKIKQLRLKAEEKIK